MGKEPAPAANSETAATSAVVASPDAALDAAHNDKKLKLLSSKTSSYLKLLISANPTKLDVTLLITGTLAAIAAGIPVPILGILFGQLVNDLNTATCGADQASQAGASYQSAVNKKVVQVVYVTVIGFIAVYIHTVSWSLFGNRLAQRLREKYFQSLLRQEASFFDNLSAGEVSSRLNGDIAIIQTGTSEKVGMCIGSTSFFVTAYIIAFIKDAKLAGMLVSLAPAFLLMSLVGSKYIGKYTGKMSDYVASAASIASEGLSNIAVVHAFSANARLEAKFSAELTHAKNEGIKKAMAAAIQSGLLYFIAFSGNALAFWQGSRTIAKAVAQNSTDASVGTTYTVIFILVDASIIISQVAPFLQIFGAAGAAFDKLQKDINHVSPIDGTTDEGGKVLTSVTGNIELKNVSFIYPSRPDRAVLRDFSAIFPSGKQTAIVGLSGSGKSTIASLVSRLYDPTSGKVLLDGEDIRDLNVRHLRSHISLVQQEPTLLDRSILENIALGLVNSPAAKHAHFQNILYSTQLAELADAIRNGKEIKEAVKAYDDVVADIVQEVQDAALLADAMEFINRLEFGLATTVGSTGNLLSGGQRQRISLARAVVRDPKILILDEATALLDSTSEQRIRTAMEKISEGRTVISIAHRLSTIRNSDNIIVMKNGVILEQGTHSELIALGSAYADMVRLQSLSSQRAGDDASSVATTRNNSIELTSAEKVPTTKAEEDTVVSEKDGLEAVAESLEAQEGGSLAIKRSTWSILRNMAPILRPYTMALILAFTAAIIVGSCYSAEAVIFGNTVDALSPCQTESEIRRQGRFFGLMFFLVAIIEFFANFFSWSAFGFVAEKIVYTVRVLSFRSLFEQDLQWHQSEKRTPSMLLSFITKDGNILAGLTGSTLGTCFSIIVNLFVAIILTHAVAWRIALVCLVTVPIVLGSGLMQLRELSRFEERHEKAYANSVGITVEAVNSIKTVAALSLEREILGVYHRSLKAPRKEVASMSAYANLWLAITYSISNFVYALAYWWGAKQIIAGRYTQTQFFIVVFALLVSAQLWGQMFVLAPEISKARLAIARILNLIDIGSTGKPSGPASSLILPSPPEKDVEVGSGTTPSDPGAQNGGVGVTFRDVEFAYPARPQIQVLRGMNLDIRSGQFCALVGPSGAGKSTVISLIERMYSPLTGSISINGADIARCEGVTFRDQIALVPQESVLFEGSIRFNVALGARPGYEPTDEEIEEACRLANIHDTIISLPDGYNTRCGPNGSQLSGGQRQRLSIARALVRKPRLLLLDESTSALDAESEKLLQDGLEKAARGITVVAIAHRLNTIRKADVIFLIEGGQCIDQGTHAELIERSETYRINALHQTVDE